MGKSTMLIGEDVMDLQNDRAAIVSGFGSGYPERGTHQDVTQLSDISKLEEIMISHGRAPLA